MRTQFVAALVGPDRESIGKDCGPARCGERGLQHHRAVHVLTADLELPYWPDREKSAGGVKQAAEHRWAVEPGEAQPVHRSVAADERSRAAVRQQGVISNRQAARQRM